MSESSIRHFEADADDPTVEALQFAQQHHDACVERLQSVVDQRDKGIRIGGDEGRPPLADYEAGSPEASAFRVGITIALHIFGEFPVSLARSGSPEAEQALASAKRRAAERNAGGK